MGTDLLHSQKGEDKNMFHKFKKTLSLLICMAFVFSVCIGNVFAESDNSVQSKVGQTKTVGTVTMEIVADDANSITVKAVDSSDENEEMFLTVDKETKKTIAEVKSYADKKKDKKNFKLSKFNVSVDTIDTDTGEVSMDLTDKVTGQKFKVKKDKDNKNSSKFENKAKAQVIPLVVSALALAAQWVAQQLLYITIAGMVMIAASQAISKIRNSSYTYFAAYTQANYQVYIGDPISYSTALSRVKSNVFGRDVFCKLSSQASALQKAAVPWGEPYAECGTGSGQYWHYHSWNHTYCNHAYFATWG